jgi:NAD-dependent dihydropyrimidine dehydrogenase PreA subunit
MYIDQEVCTGCGECVPYCTMNAIEMSDGGYAEIVRDECVECNSCLRADVCPSGAFVKEELEWPRSLRWIMSDPQGVHPITGIAGRGTAEIKTNDVTGRIKRGTAGVAVEVGRPNSGTRLRDVERVAMALASLGVEFEPANPVTAMMTDRSTGKIRDDVLGEKVLSGILEFPMKPERLGELALVLRKVAGEIDTVFSVDLACVAEEDGSVPMQRWAEEAGLWISPNGKLNVGLGKPAASVD